MATVDHVASVARRKVNAPDGWKICKWEVIGDTKDLLVEGGVPTLRTRGPRKGTPKWDGPRQKCVVTDAEEKAEAARYELETGNCANCGGDGKAWAGWNCETGTRWRDCKRCNATGKAGAAP